MLFELGLLRARRPVTSPNPESGRGSLACAARLWHGGVPIPPHGQMQPRTRSQSSLMPGSPGSLDPGASMAYPRPEEAT